jgi:LppP/LprE lipoprotein
VRRILISSAAVGALAVTIGGGGVAGADPIPDCGPDQPTALAIAVAHEKHDPLTQAPWSLIPVQSNFDSCADLSAMLVTIDNPKPNSPRQGFLFHRGTYVGTTLATSRPFTTLDTAASTPDTAVFVFTSGRTCATCNDGITRVVHYHWNGVVPVMVETSPPPQDWPTA